MTESLESGNAGTAELTAFVHKELLHLRGSHGQLNIQKFARYSALRRVCGSDDLLDAFLMFERELRRYIREGNRDEIAAALSISAPADTVLDRLEHVVGKFEERGEIKDQRTGRRWSDAGLKKIAAELVYMAEVQGRLGTELLTIEIAGNPDSGLRFVIYQLTTKNLDERPPLVRLWRHRDGGEDLEELSDRLTVDLETVPAAVVGNMEFKMKRHHVHVELPADLREADASSGDTIYSISIEGRDAPMRTVSFVDEVDLGSSFMTRVSAYRSIASVEIVAR